MITGATSGIGLATAHEAARRGARLVLSSRNAEALHDVADELKSSTQVEVVAADVADERAMRGVAEAAIRRFGGFDTWVNNAGVSIYGALREISIEDQRRLMETNFWGVVIGSRIALDHLGRHGGALINIGSVLSERAVPIQGIYSASKHAVLGYTDALRVEVEHDELPVAVTLIKPSSIATPFNEHAKNYTGRETRLPPPQYDPRLVADAILFAAEHPVRSLTVGAGGWMLTALAAIAPGLADTLMSRTLYAGQIGSRPASRRSNSLYAPGRGGREHGDHPMSLRHSPFTSAQERPWTATALTVGALALAGLLLTPRKAHGGDRRRLARR